MVVVGTEALGTEVVAESPVVVVGSGVVVVGSDVLVGSVELVGSGLVVVGSGFVVVGSTVDVGGSDVGRGVGDHVGSAVSVVDDVDDVRDGVLVDGDLTSDDLGDLEVDGGFDTDCVDAPGIDARVEDSVGSATNSGARFPLDPSEYAVPVPNTGLVLMPSAGSGFPSPAVSANTVAVVATAIMTTLIAMVATVAGAPIEENAGRADDVAWATCARSAALVASYDIPPRFMPTSPAGNSRHASVGKSTQVSELGKTSVKNTV